MNKTTLAMIAPSLLVLMGEAPAPELSIGGPAPVIEIAHWLTGEEVRSFEPGRVYVLEFWATWCGPCVKGMPHLSELQAKHAGDGVTIIGVSDEPLPKVVKFVAAVDPQTGQPRFQAIRYSIATDPDRSAYESYMVAAQRAGLPAAFVIGREGLVEWIGHPIDLDEPLARVVAGTWDRGAFKTTYEQAMKPVRELARLRSQIDMARTSGDWEAVLEGYDRIIALGDDVEYRYTRSARFRTLLSEMKQYQRAYAYGRELLKFAWDDDPIMLNHLAWFIADDAIDQRDLDLALEASQRANELTNWEDSSFLPTLLQVHVLRGEWQAAMRWGPKVLSMISKEEWPEDQIAKYARMVQTAERELAAAKGGG